MGVGERRGGNLSGTNHPKAGRSRPWNTCGPPGHREAIGHWGRVRGGQSLSMI